MNNITICTQIKNRFYQFEQTFNHNISIINKYDNVNWTIVDIQSNDGLENFFEQFLKSYDHNNINYYKIINNIDYSIPISKNFSLRLSTGHFLFNLDADNYLDGCVDKILSLDDNTGIQCSVFKKGIYGRIGAHSDKLKIVGGYDESFLPAGSHDIDLINRLTLIGYHCRHFKCQKLPVPNSKQDTIINFSNNTLSWDEMNNINKKKREINKKNKNIYPNKIFTNASFIHNFKNIIKLSDVCW
jgi:hypothetical protein